MSSMGTSLENNRERELEEVIECSLAKSRQSRPAEKKATRVAVLMSGGVDSSTTALLLQRQGYEIVGVTGWLLKSGSRCCDTGMIDAARVCEQLEVEHHAVDLRELFRLEVIDDFHKSYSKARTPLPCSLCNTIIKWGALLNYSLKHLDADYIATGHYARIVQTDSGARLARSKDVRKDQSYVLWGLTHEQLNRTLLPLGDYTKDEIREIASAANLATASRKDSQDLCFIPEGMTTQQYLQDYIKETPGPIIHTATGEVLGSHNGTHNFTVGQRRGIGVAYHEPLYVTSIDWETRTVYVGSKDHLLAQELSASAVNWLDGQIPQSRFRAYAKIRYNSPVAWAWIEPVGSDKVKVVFDDPQPAITAGQVLGIYDETDTFLVAGGWID